MHVNFCNKTKKKIFKTEQALEHPAPVQFFTESMHLHPSIANLSLFKMFSIVPVALITLAAWNFATYSPRAQHLSRASACLITSLSSCTIRSFPFIVLIRGSLFSPLEVDTGTPQRVHSFPSTFFFYPRQRETIRKKRGTKAQAQPEGVKDPFRPLCFHKTRLLRFITWSRTACTYIVSALSYKFLFFFLIFFFLPVPYCNREAHTL